MLLVPASALLNPLTILTSSQNTIPAHLFPEQPSKPNTKRRRVSISQRLNTTQLLTLHLALTRDPDGRHGSAWEVYLDTLPRSFRPWHPLTWVVPPKPKGKVNGHGGATNEHGDAGMDKLGKVPIEARENVLRVKKRFDEDLEVLQKVLVRHPRAILLHLLTPHQKLEEPFREQGLAEAISVDDILWAWLIGTSSCPTHESSSLSSVNTRSVSIPLGLGTPTDLFNHTLVPILDLVNHSSDPEECLSKPRQVPTPGPSSIRSKTGKPRVKAHLVPGKIAFELRSERDLEAGQELRFEYHAHANSELWAEYGFAESPNGGEWRELRWGQADVARYLEELWDKTEDRVHKEETLKACGCFG